MVIADLTYKQCQLILNISRHSYYRGRAGFSSPFLPKSKYQNIRFKVIEPLHRMGLIEAKKTSAGTLCILTPLGVRILAEIKARGKAGRVDPAIRGRQWELDL